MAKLWPFGRRGGAQVDTTEDYRALGYPDQRKVARDSRGRLYVAYRKKYRIDGLLRYHVFVARSDDGGATWGVPAGGPIERVGDYTQRVPALAIDADDVLHVVWYGNDAASAGENERQIKYARSANGGQSWSAWANVAPLAGYRDQRLWQEHPTIDVAAGMLYVAWQGMDAEHPTASQAKFTRSDDGGRSWAPWRNVGAGPGNRSRPAIVAAHSGARVYLLAYGAAGGTQQLVWSSSDDRGDSWAPWSQVAPSGADQRHVSIALDSRDRLHAAWRQAEPAGRPQVCYAVYDGQGWSAPLAIGPSQAACQFFPTIAVAPGNRLYVAWTEAPDPSGCPADDPKSGQIVYASRPAGGAWGPPEALAGAGTAAIYPCLRRGAYLDGGALDIIWLENDGGAALSIRHATLRA
jgi:hypothetical protein